MLEPVKQRIEILRSGLDGAQDEAQAMLLARSSEATGGRFGFVERVRIGENHRAQLSFGEGALIVGDVRNERRPPRPGEVTHSVVVRVDDARGHCQRAREHGARILMEPTDFEYGERQYNAEDYAGHQWTFSETLADVAPEQWGGTSVAQD